MSLDTNDRIDRRWEVRRGSGPVLATAVHAGHELRPEVDALTALSDDERRLEEDPMTEVLASVGDHLFVTHASRFEVDLNRPTDEAVYRVPDDAWGLDLWTSGTLPEAIVRESLRSHASFYEMMGGWLEELIQRHGHVLLLDVHSFNEREATPTDDADLAEFPDIDLGVTTADDDRFGPVIDSLRAGLRTIELTERSIDVRDNVRFPDGGNWPEWVFAEYGDSVCTITLEYKKAFMDEATGRVDLAHLERLRAGLAGAVESARTALV